MTDWKMPEWLIEMWDAIGLHSRVSSPEMLETYMNMEYFQHPVGYYQIKMLERLRKHNLLSTPSERDAQNKRIAELEARLKIEGDHPFPEGYDALDMANDRIKILKAEVERLQSIVVQIRKATCGFIGSDGKLEAYMDCPHCGKEVIITESSDPRDYKEASDED